MHRKETRAACVARDPATEEGMLSYCIEHAHPLPLPPSIVESGEVDQRLITWAGELDHKRVHYTGVAYGKVRGDALVKD